MEKLFNIKDANFSNEPTDEEINFISVYLEKLFSTIEGIDLITKTSEDRQIILTTIYSVKNSIHDLLSPDGGNYYKLLIGLNSAIDFENRLSNIIEKLSQYNSGDDVFALNYVNSSVIEVHNPNYGYKTFELNEYLNRLMLIQPLEDDQIEISAEEQQTLKHLADYLNHIITKHGDGQTITNKVASHHKSTPVVFFLRDTLLLYLGARRLQSKGLSIDARAVLINRKLIKSFVSIEGRNPVYKKLYNSLFQVLSAYQGTFSREFTDQFKELFTVNMTYDEIQLLDFISEYFKGLLGSKNNFIAIETAAHGTMPLLTHIATGRMNSLEMFTSTPWLYEFYSANIFSSNFINMRSLESLISQEELFQFAYVSDAKIYVNETCDPTTLSRAKLEIGVFLNIVDKQALLT
jgi:hypothetical protein